MAFSPEKLNNLLAENPLTELLTEEKLVELLCSYGKNTWKYMQKNKIQKERDAYFRVGFVALCYFYKRLEGISNDISRHYSANINFILPCLGYGEKYSLEEDILIYDWISRIPDEFSINPLLLTVLFKIVAEPAGISISKNTMIPFFVKLWNIESERIKHSAKS